MQTEGQERDRIPPSPGARRADPGRAGGGATGAPATKHGAAPERPYAARTRIADNLFVQRKRIGCSQQQLGERAMVSANRIGAFENGRVTARIDLYVRLAGAPSITVGDLLGGVRWTPAVIELSLHARYEVVVEEGAHETRARSSGE